MCLGYMLLEMLAFILFFLTFWNCLGSGWGLGWEKEEGKEREMWLVYKINEKFLNLKKSYKE